MFNIFVNFTLEHNPSIQMLIANVRIHASNTGKDIDTTQKDQLASGNRQKNETPGEEQLKVIQDNSVI